MPVLVPVSAESALPITWRKEDFSLAYVFALGVAAGVAWTVRSRDINSCDALFFARDDEHEDGPQLSVQLKCTESGLNTSKAHSGQWRFVLPSQNYDHLRKARTHPPRILVVVKCPPVPAHWISTAAATELVMFAEAWWVRLVGADPLADGQKSTTISIPQAQRFDTAALLANMCSCP